MPKLKTLKPQLKTLAPLVRKPLGDRYSAPDYKRWYWTAKWQRLREKVRIRDNFMCRMCGRVLGARGEAHVDHIQPHKGDEALFWAEDNLQTLCAHCHNALKQRAEKSGET